MAKFLPKLLTERKSGSHTKIESTGKYKKLKIILGAIQYMAKFLPKLSERTVRLRKLLKKNEPWKWGPEQETDFNRIKQMLTEGPCLAHYAKDKDNMVTTDASKTGLGITLWQKQDDGNINPIAYGSRYLNDTEKSYSIGELELLAVVWGLEKFRFYLYGKKIYLYTDHQALEPLIKRNRCNKQYSARLTRWLDRLAHFDIAIQHIAGSNSKFTDYLSRNPVGGATPEDNYDEEYVNISVLSEQAKLNINYGPIFTDQSKCEKTTTETTNETSEERNENCTHQSQSNRTFQNKSGVNKRNRSVKVTSGQSKISASKSSCKLKQQSNNIQKKKLSIPNPEITDMDRENFYHWGATREIMQIIRKRNKSPETRRLVELRNALSKPGTLRRRYDPHTQRTIFAPTRPNKRSREEIAEIDAELLQKSNRLGGGYQSITEEVEETGNPEEGEIEPDQPETEEDSVIMRGDNLPIVDLSKFNTDGQEAHYIQINHIVGKLSGNKKITEDTIKKAEFEFMLDLKTLISKTAIDPELTRVRASMRREDRDTTPDGYRPAFDKLSIRLGLVFMDDQIVVPIDLRRRLLDILHFGHAGMTKMTAEAKIFWWPDINRDIENKVKDCIACLASGKSLKYQLPNSHYGKLKKLSEPGQEIQIDFTGKLHNKRINGDVQILIAVDRFSKWPTVKICKTAETKEVLNFLTNNFNLYGVPEKIKSDKGGAFISKEYKEFCKNRNIEIEYCTPRLHTGNGVVERAIQTLKNLMLANIEEGTDLTESVNRALRVMRFTIHTGLKRTPFELHHGRKSKTELTNIIKDGKTYLSDWSEISISAPNKPKIPIYVGRDADGEITNHIIMAKTKAEEKQANEGPKSPKKKNSVSYPFSFVEKNYNKKSLEGKFQNKIQTAIDGTENTVKTNTGKIIHRKFISGPLFQTEKKNRKDAALVNAEITPKNRHCLRGLDGKYGRWDEILRDILNGKLRIVKKTEDEYLGIRRRG